MLRRSFDLDSDIKAARLYISGLGLYFAEINGKSCGNELMTPYFNAYDSWIQYQTYDVTSLLSQGKNAIGVMLGRGWSMGTLESDTFKLRQYVSEYTMICELHIEYDDGREVVVCSDDNWKSRESPVIDSGIYLGEIWDANIHEDHWSKPEMNDAKWHGVRPYHLSKDLLHARLSPPERVIEESKPVSFFRTKKGNLILDFGQNASGTVRVKFDAPKGTRITLKHFELLVDGEMSIENLRLAKQEFVFISDGRPTEMVPHFSTQGFRYLMVDGWPGDLDPNDFTRQIIHTEMDRTGYIETSDPMVNKLFENILWTQKSNFTDIPTDCPQRNERMGYTGDSQVFAGSSCFNMDTDAFFHKYMYDLWLEQQRCGSVPNISPAIHALPGNEHNSFAAGNTGWADAACVIPWTVYLHYGDKSILSRQYESMREHVEWYIRQDDGSHVTNTYTLGDWLCIDEDINATPHNLISTAYYAHCTRILAQSAQILDKANDAEKYGRRADEVASAFARMFVTEGGLVACNTQTGIALAIGFDLVPEHHRKSAGKQLYHTVASRNFRISAGFIGVASLCPALTLTGYNDAAYSLLLNEEFPGWMFEIKNGATTTWEGWDAHLDSNTLSHNHFALGSIVEWMYRHMCGYNPDPEAPGFRHAVLMPKPNGKVNWLKSRLETPAGQYESEWRIENDGSLRFRFVIPFNATAKIILPHAPNEGVIINGHELKSFYELDGSVSFDAGSGEYEIMYTPTCSYINKYSANSHSANELCAIPWTRAIINKHIPFIAILDQSIYGYTQNMQEFAEFAGLIMPAITSEKILAADSELKTLTSWR